MKKINVQHSNWNALDGITKPIPIRVFAGVNTLDRFSIDEGQAVDMRNLSIDRFPSLMTRKGKKRIGVLPSTGIQGLMTRKESELYVFQNGKILKLNGQSWNEIASGLSASAIPSFCNFKGNLSDYHLIVANGVDPVKKINGNNVTNLNGAPAGIKFIDAHDNRLYGAVGSSIKFSALRKADDWSTVDEAGEIVVEGNKGEDITGLKAGTGHITVFKSREMWELYGTSPINYKLVPVSDQVGCVAGHTIQNVGGVLYFLAHDGVYRYTGGVHPKKDFSMVIDGYIKRINIDHRHKSVAGTDGERYYLAVPLDNETEPNCVLVYNPVINAWYVYDYGIVKGFAYFGDHFYVANTDEVHSIEGNDDNGSSIVGYWCSKPFNLQSIAQKHKWYKAWVIADIQAGAVLRIYLSQKDSGEDWKLLREIAPSVDVQNLEIPIPVHMYARSNFMRVKLETEGQVTIHEFTRQERAMPMGVM